MHPIRALLRRCNLSETNTIELSDLLTDNATIIDKKIIPEEKPTPLNYGTPTKYEITFQGTNTGIMIFYSEEWFRRFNIGDKVIIQYQTKHNVIKDYVPPNFDQKQELIKHFSGYNIIKIEPLKQPAESSPNL